MPESEPDGLHRDQLIRQVRQRLESLARAGVDRIPVPDLPTAPSAPAPRASARSSVPVVPRPRPEAIAPPPEPVRPTPRPPFVASPPASSKPAFSGSLFESDVPEGPLYTPEERPRILDALRAEVAACERCPLLVPGRTQTVFGEGSPTARLMFVGEAPGETEDRTGRPFVGKAGQLLTDMITKGMGLAREDVYIANILKSRPPNNRDPMPDEVRNCLPFLERQIAIIRPEFLCILGKPATHALLDTAMPLSRLRGKWHRYRGIPAVVTWHPAYLLRNPPAKKDTWDDLQMLMKAMGLKMPGSRRG